MSQKQQLRQHMRTMRQGLSSSEQATAAKRLNQQLRNSQLLQSAQNIALYLACDGEIDLAATLQTLWAEHKNCYLPILPSTGKQLSFGHYNKHTPLSKNRYGINEPVSKQLLKPTALDAVLLPLVAFDLHGNRLGMGGGYYDYSFAGLSDQLTLIGCAHEAQRVDTLPTESWDLPLQAIVTDQNFYIF